MSRINTNIQSLIAQRTLAQNNQNLNTTLERLSTGLRINRGKDDPAGLIASENLKADITSINAAINNGERADQVVNIAEGGLTEISSSLNELQGLLTESANSAGLSDTEKEANQLQIDSILQTVDRIASSTNFQGDKLLNGRLDFETTQIDDGIVDFQVNAAKFDTATQDVDVNITQSAQQGSLFLSFGAGTLQFSAGGGEQFSIEVAGELGSREVSFASQTSLADVAATINTFTDITGVTAEASGNGVVLRADDFGSDGFVSVQNTGDAVLNNANTGITQFSAQDQNTIDTSLGSVSFLSSGQNPVRDEGQDVQGTINGIVATGEGRSLRASTDFLDVELLLASQSTGGSIGADTLGTGQAFSLTGGGATFQLDGDVGIAGRVGLGIQEVASRRLGDSELGFLDELGTGEKFNVVDASESDLADAQKVVDAAIEQVSSLRGRLGAFQANVIGATVRNLGVAAENTAAANSVIRDADFAQETAGLSRNQTLVQAATQSLALANQNPNNALQLLG